MADFSSPVALGIQTPDMMSKLSQLLTIRGQQQELAKQAAETQQTQQTTRQRAAMAQVSWDKHIGEDGTLDLNSVGKDADIRKAAGDTYPEILEKAAQIKQAQTLAKQSLLNLNGSQIAAFGSTVGGLANDEDVVKDTPAGRAKVKNAFQQFTQTYGPDAAKAVAPYAAPLQNAPQGKLGSVLQHVQMQTQDAGKQLEMQRPKIIKNEAGQAIAVNPQNPAQVALVGGGGPLNPTTAQATIQNTAATGIANRVQQAQAAANNTIQAQDALTRARAILDEPNAPNTGAGFEKMKGIKNFLSSVGVDTQGATDSNSLVKNLARYEAARATQAGLGGTDAARELAHNGSPNVSVDNKALQGIITQSLATEKALATYANIQTKTKDGQALAKNEADFRSIPNLVEGYEYGLSRNAKEADEFLARHGISHAQMKETRTRIKEFEGR